MYTANLHQLRREFFLLHSLCLGILFNSTPLICNFKTRLGGEICPVHFIVKRNGDLRRY